MRYLACLFATLVAFAIPLHAAEALRGRASVHDGDTIRIGAQSIRIWGIDAAELRQTCVRNNMRLPCGEMARAALARLVEGHDITCMPKGRSYQRIVAQCFAAGRDLAAEMTRLGMAQDYTRYSRGFYAAEEAAAKEAGAGWWSMAFEPPARWRACHLPQRKKHRPENCML